MKNEKMSAQGGKKLTHNLKWLTLSIAMGIVIGGGLIAVKAWTEPTVAPPGGNIGAPINTSGVGQQKTGGLVLNTGGATNGLIVQSGNVGIGHTTPSTKLQVAGGNVRVGNDPNATDVYPNGIITRNFNTGTDLARNDHADSYSFHVRGTTAMNIYSDRNVGIGNVSISPNLKLDVEGKVGATEYCDQDGNNCKAVTAMGGGATNNHTDCYWSSTMGNWTKYYVPAGYHISGIWHHEGGGGYGLYYCKY